MFKILLAVIICLLISNMLYADAIFDEIVSVMKSSPTSEQIENLKYKYIKDPNNPHPLITGTGYITNIIAPTDEGEFEIVLSDTGTDSEGGYAALINVAIGTFDRDIWARARNYKKGDKVYFTGQLTDIFYGTLYIKGVTEISQ